MGCSVRQAKAWPIPSNRQSEREKSNWKCSLWGRWRKSTAPPGVGIPAFYTPTGVGSVFAESDVSSIEKNRKPKETRVINGQTYVLEYALKPDYAFVHAIKGDKEGNLRYAKTARNFNHVMATSAKVTIAEVENLVEAGEIDGDDIHTPGVYVKRIVKVPRPKFAITID